MPLAPEQLQLLRVLSVLRPLNVTCGKVRIGGPNDGGYVMANDFDGVEVCYSIGVGPQVIWDEAMAGRNMDIYQYDHTVEAVPAEHPRFHYAKLGIGPNLDDPDLITLEKMLEDNGHAKSARMILKMDVEGAEWDVLDGMRSNTLGRFDQLIVEFHGLEFLGQESFLLRADRTFRNIAHTHVPIHIHGNNYAGMEVVKGIPVPHVIEVTYARRDRFEFIENEEIFPTHLDDPCRPDAPDLYLRSFKYSI